MDVSLQVFKEPRGFIRVIQCIMAILAFSTTAGFSTECDFSIKCPGITEPIPVEYDFGYPFSITENVLVVPRTCKEPKDTATLILPFDYSSGAGFYVATGVLTFLYTIGILVVYMFFHQLYSNDPKLPVADLAVSSILTVFWLAGSSAWAQGVTDLKHYLHPETLFGLLQICNENKNDTDNICHLVEDGSYGTLNASLVLGFANFILWAGSLWFIYKETIFHTPQAVDATQNQAPKDVGRV